MVVVVVVVVVVGVLARSAHAGKAGAGLECLPRCPPTLQLSYTAVMDMRCTRAGLPVSSMLAVSESSSVAKGVTEYLISGLVTGNSKIRASLPLCS